MQNGISIYLGLDNTLEENLNLIHLAHKYNLNRIFTSFHIPETDISHFQQDLQTILKLTQKYNMEVICDVSPNTLALLNLDTLNVRYFVREIEDSSIIMKSGVLHKTINKKLTKDKASVRLYFHK